LPLLDAIPPLQGPRGRPRCRPDCILGDFVVVTSNARDFIRLLNVEVHPGLIVLRESGLTRDKQWDRIRPVIEHVLESSDDNFLVNKLVEISDVDEWEIREIPER
jgi:hypothetical protein